VFGERRYQASLMADMLKIPVVILNVLDEMAEKMAVTKNLQRKDATPIEKANTYQKLIESGRHDIQSLIVRVLSIFLVKIIKCIEIKYLYL
jgi:ParB family chromosome partitioning protein